MENHQTIQALPKSNPLRLYSGSDKQIQGVRSDGQSTRRTMDQDHPQEKEMQQGKMAVEEALKIAEKRRNTKAK